MQKIFLLFFIWRIGLFAVTSIATQVLPPNFGKSFPYYEEELINTDLPHFIWSFGNFDGVHYLRIAKDGYVYQYTQAFFPLYPLLIKFVAFLTFGNFLIAGLLISNIAFFFALVIFHKLVNKYHGGKIAFWSCLFLLTFPTSFYFGSIYTEGLFFLMIISVFLLFDKNKIWLASIIGLFASLTRLIGIFLTPSLMLGKKVTSLIPLLIVPLGLLVYMFYLRIEFNNPFYFLTSQAVWGQERSTTQIVLLPQVFWRYLKILATTNGLTLLSAAFELTATVFALAILVVAYKKVKTEWLVFSFLAVLTPTLTGTLTSMPRYILVAFPIFIVLGLIKSTLFKILILTIFVMLLLISTTLFTQGYWVA
ncbi:hypothetical protein A2W70_05260 [Candidatus Curtissbacteria bacterium RIFCSPLOWO2_02_41_11]|uniref:Glycosyltransferase RgtA/B/C/D-like domain-containing protein n=1 Tax=Candidatus Curtissbacteria bacterium RIFCSPLOWO2_02_41_11 TaxID=1797731 RepID=A0A1F5HPQ0_9BACT|nr:MAG: hypothetical protein A2W70_05260 [Candidatus Curtissbacteria bacterium RIFCSPLOWO2_02_41_11]